MLVTYDPGKSLRNEEERGLSFELAERFDWSDPSSLKTPARIATKGVIQALGFIDEHLHVLVFTPPRDGAIHVNQLAPGNRPDETRHATQTES